MAQPSSYSPVFSGPAADFLLSLPSRRQRILMDQAYGLARQPFRKSDYATRDAAGHNISHLLFDDFLLTY